MKFGRILLAGLSVFALAQVATAQLIVVPGSGDPNHIVAGNDLKIVFVADAAQRHAGIVVDATYSWKCTVKDKDGNETDDFKAPDPVDKSFLALEELRAESSYACTLTRTVGDKQGNYVALIMVPVEGAIKPVAMAVSLPGEDTDRDRGNRENGETADRQPDVEDEESAAALPPLTAEHAQKLSPNELLIATRDWANGIQVAKSSQADLIIDVAFIRRQLEGVGRSGVAYSDQKRVATVSSLYREMYTASQMASREISAERAWDAWDNQRNVFERQMSRSVEVGGLSLPPDTINKWKQFLDEWEAEVKKKDRSSDEIATALQQAALAITGIVAGIDDAAIKAAFSGGKPQARTRSTGSIWVPSYGRHHSHGYSRHLRRMGRIRMWHSGR